MYFYADHCNFEGRVENDFFQWMPELRELDLSHNQLSGRIPLDILFQETTLVVLNLAYNQFTGEFPYQMETNVKAVVTKDKLHTMILLDNQSTTDIFWLRYLAYINNKFAGSSPIFEIGSR